MATYFLYTAVCDLSSFPLEDGQVRHNENNVELGPHFEFTQRQDAWVECNMHGDWEVTCRLWASWEDDAPIPHDKWEGHHPDCQCNECYYGHDLATWAFNPSEY